MLWSTTLLTGSVVTKTVVRFLTETERHLEQKRNRTQRAHMQTLVTKLKGQTTKQKLKDYKHDKRYPV